MNLSGNVILVTGGGSGIGAAIATRFKAMGNPVIICGRNKIKLQAAAENMGVNHIVCDVSDEQQVKAMLEQINQIYGHLDILVNCAGVMHTYDFFSDPDTASRIQTEIEINAIAPLKLTYAALPLLQQSSHPAIVFVSSGLAYIPFFATPAYSGSKALIHHSAQALRQQFKKHGIRVFELLPPITDTPMAEGVDVKGFKKSSPEEVVDALIDGMLKEKFEIAAGASRQLRFMSRLAPGFLFKQMTQAFEGK
ncbi:MAG: SDR family NAD(P)-dependent oxidoreductase [Paraglaciecola sp.]|nr:SDR family NAD(P)-dependent oxidoreductase [Paraglaciecola sp.]NCT49434.1 SDR family NAD(P)-dependent oxidoreductase [Paraglaciecola sp.]